METEKESESFREVALTLGSINKESITKRFRISLRKHLKSKTNLLDLTEKIDKCLRTSNSKIAFKLIKRLAIIHPSKREGGRLRKNLYRPREYYFIMFIIFK